MFKDAFEKDTRQRLQTNYQKKHNTILAQWMKLSFINQLIEAKRLTLLAAHWKTGSGTVTQFQLSDLMVIIAENPCSHSHIDRNINN